MDYELTPYDILGLAENARLGDIHCAYRNLIRLVHPDKNLRVHQKMGWTEQDCAEAFNRIRKAYKTLLKQKKISLKDVPSDNVDYDIEDEFIIIENYEKEREFNISRFNEKFDQLKKHYDKENPNTAGYAEFSHASGAFSVESSPGLAGDASIERYKEPEAKIKDPSSVKPLSHEFGLTVIEDFSIQSQEKGTLLEGTDIGKAFAIPDYPTESIDEEKESLETLLEKRIKEREESIAFSENEKIEKRKKEERKQQLRWKVLQERDERLSNVSLIHDI